MGEADMIKAAVAAVDKFGAQILPEDVLKIARQSALAGAACAVLPVSGTGTAAMVVNIGVMCVRINSALGIPLSKNKLNSVVSGLVVGLGTRQLIKMGANELIKLIPGAGTAAGAALNMYVFAASTYTAAFMYLKTLSALDDVNKDNAFSDKIVAGIGDFAKSGKQEIADMFASAKDMFKNIRKEDAIAAGEAAKEEATVVEAEMTADGKDLDPEVARMLEFDKLNLDKESFKPSKVSQLTGWLKKKSPFS